MIKMNIRKVNSQKKEKNKNLSGRTGVETRKTRAKRPDGRPSVADSTVKARRDSRRNRFAITFSLAKPFAGNEWEHNNNENNDSDNSKKPAKVCAVLSRYAHVHSKKTSNQIEWNQNRTNECNSSKDLSNTVVWAHRLHLQLSKIVAVGTRKNLFISI